MPRRGLCVYTAYFNKLAGDYVPQSYKHKKEIFRQFSFEAVEVYYMLLHHYYFNPRLGLRLEASSLHIKMEVLVLINRMSNRRPQVLGGTTPTLFLFTGIHSQRQKIERLKQLWV
jgi:hypothetical protein